MDGDPCDGTDADCESAVCCLGRGTPERLVCASSEAACRSAAGTACTVGDECASGACCDGQCGGSACVDAGPSPIDAGTLDGGPGPDGGTPLGGSCTDPIVIAHDVMMAGGITTFFDTPLTLSHPRAMANDCLPERAGALGIVVQFDVPRNVSYTLTATPMGGAGPLELVLFDGDCIDVGNRCQTSAGTDPLEIVSSKTNEHPKDYVVVELRSFGEGGTVQLQLTR